MVTIIIGQNSLNVNCVHVKRDRDESLRERERDTGSLLSGSTSEAQWRKVPFKKDSSKNRSVDKSLKGTSPVMSVRRSLGEWRISGGSWNE